MNFNCLLALVPLEIFDYVVIHELCHLKQMNHSAKFWVEVEKHLPQYKASRKWLKQQSISLIHHLQGQKSAYSNYTLAWEVTNNIFSLPSATFTVIMTNNTACGAVIVPAE